MTDYDGIPVDIWHDGQGVIVKCGDLVGASRCRGGDTFDLGVGIAIALIRARRGRAEWGPVGEIYATAQMPVRTLWALMRARENYRGVKKEARAQARESIGYWLADQWNKKIEAQL